jgi:hypothetical protein
LQIERANNFPTAAIGDDEDETGRSAEGEVVVTEDEEDDIDECVSISAFLSSV